MDVGEPRTTKAEDEASLDSITLVVRTMGGAEHCLENLHATTPLQEVHLELCQRMRAPPFCVKLIDPSGGGPLEVLSKTLSEAGLAGPDASLVVVRVPGDSSDYIGLFKDLLKAFYQGQHEQVQRLIDTGAGFDADGKLLMQNFCGREIDAGSSGSNGSTMLHLAVRHRLTDLALQVIALDVDVNVPNEHGRTALVQAAIKQNQVLVDALLDAKADPLALDRDRKSAYSYAAEKRNDKVACRLLVPGYAPGDRDLLMACAYSLPQTALALIELGGVPRPECRDEQGRTALHYAYGNGLSEVVEALLAKGADPEARDNKGRRPADGFGDIVQIKSNCTAM